MTEHRPDPEPEQPSATDSHVGGSVRRRTGAVIAGLVVVMLELACVAVLAFVAWRLLS